MDGLRERWSGLSRAWKTFWIALVILVIFFAATTPQLIPLSILWAAGIATVVRLRDHFIPPDEEPRDRP
jgi:uncharacterized membrane protein